MKWLDEQDFYEICYAYRWADPSDPPRVVEKFESLKEYIRGQFQCERMNPERQDRR